MAAYSCPSLSNVLVLLKNQNILLFGLYLLVLIVRHNYHIHKSCISFLTNKSPLLKVVLPETVDDDDNDSDEAVSRSSQSPVPTQSSIQPSSSQAQSSTAQPFVDMRKPPRPKDKSSATKTGKKVDQAIVTIAEQMTSTQRLQENLEEVIKDANSPHTAWAHWIGTGSKIFPMTFVVGFSRNRLICSCVTRTKYVVVHISSCSLDSFNSPNPPEHLAHLAYHNSHVNNNGQDPRLQVFRICRSRQFEASTRPAFQVYLAKLLTFRPNIILTI